MRDEHPDRAFEGHAREDDDRALRREEQERLARHTPATPDPFPIQNSSARGAEQAKPPTTWVTLAWTHLNGNWHDARDAGRALAELVIEASEQATQ
jgi:hypothetical protein